MLRGDQAKNKLFYTDYQYKTESAILSKVLSITLARYFGFKQIETSEDFSNLCANRHIK